VRVKRSLCRQNDTDNNHFRMKYVKFTVCKLNTSCKQQDLPMFIYIISLNWWFLEGWFMIFLAKRSIKYFIRWAIVAVSLQMSCVGLIHFIQIYWWVEWKLHADMILHGPFTETTTGRDFRKHEPSFDEICSRVRERSRWVFFCA